MYENTEALELAIEIQQQKRNVIDASIRELRRKLDNQRFLNQSETATVKKHTLPERIQILSERKLILPIR